MLAAVCLFASCQHDTPVFHQYEAVNVDGWAMQDSVVFHIDSLPQTAPYSTMLCLRATADYPYQHVSLLVTQYSMPGNRMTRKVVPVEVKHEDGTMAGKGTIFFTYEVPVTQEQLTAGDSIRIVIRQWMRSETVKGITDVGTKIVHSF